MYPAYPVHVIATVLILVFGFRNIQKGINLFRAPVFLMFTKSYIIH